MFAAGKRVPLTLVLVLPFLSSISGAGGCRSPHYRDLPWITVQTEHFIFRALPRAPLEKEEIQEAEDLFERLSSLFGVSPPSPIEVFYYPGTETMRKHSGSSLSFAKNLEVHCCAGALCHEVTHVFVGLIGAPPFFIHEGLAIGLAKDGRIWEGSSRTGEPIHSVARELLEKSPSFSVRDLIRGRHLGTVPKRFRIRLFYGHASFVKYLVDRYGMERMKRMIAETPRKASCAEVERKLEEVYGKEVSVLQEEWIEFLKKPAEPATSP